MVVVGREPVTFSVPDLAAGPRPAIKFSVVEYESSQQEIDLAERAQNWRWRPKASVCVAASSGGQIKPSSCTESGLGSGRSAMPLRNRLAHGLTSEPEWKNAESLGPDALPRTRAPHSRPQEPRRRCGCPGNRQQVGCILGTVPPRRDRSQRLSSATSPKQLHTSPIV